MNLYLLTQHTAKGFDAFDSAVVAAANVADAQGTHPAGQGRYYVGDLVRDCWIDSDTGERLNAGVTGVHGWPTRPSEVEVEWIGVANANIEAGVICASFHAG